MCMISFLNGKKNELKINDYLYEMGCKVDGCAYWTDFDSSSLDDCELAWKPLNLDFFYLDFKSQKPLKIDPNQKHIDKIADFASNHDIIEVKSISPKTKNIKQAREQLIGRILVEYKKYYEYLSFKNFTVHSENIYYVIDGPCDVKLIYSYLEDQKSWDLMKDKFHVVTPCQFFDIFCDKLQKHFDIYEN